MPGLQRELETAACFAVDARTPQAAHAASYGRAALQRAARPTYNHLWLRRPFPVARCALLWALLSSAAVPLATAQESAEALAARALFDEGRRLMSMGRVAEGCSKLEESQRLRSGIGTQFNLAECYEKLGRIASAWSLYLRVAGDTKALGQVERERVARARAEALEPKVAHLVLQVPSAVPGLELLLDGSLMPSATWGVATAIDPGEHRVVARAPGFREWQGSARVPDRGERLELTVPALVPSTATPAARTPAAAPAGPVADSSGGMAVTTPYVIGAAGVGAVVVSGLFGLRFLNKNGEAKDICRPDPDACPGGQIERHSSLLGEARGARTAGFVSLALGLVGVGVSAVWLWQSSDDERGEAASLKAELGPERARLEWRVRF